jgi:hypothetical protein
MTAFECIQNKVFDSVRDQQKEKVLVQMREDNIMSYN